MGDESEQISNEDAGEPKGGKKKPGERNTAAKAFYRAMYAGADPDPDDFGMEAAQPKGGGGGGERSGPCGVCARLQSDLEDMEKRTKEAENLYKRLAADFENYRKRVTKEREEFAAAGVQRAIEAILPALDDMDLAKTKLSTDVSPTAMMDSLNMVYNRFARCLEQIGIKQMSVIGEMFDPKFHEPVQQIPTMEVADGAVYQQLRPGYIFGEKVLRPSLVNVATADGAEEVPQYSEEGTGEVQQEGEYAYAEGEGGEAYAEGTEGTEGTEGYTEGAEGYTEAGAEGYTEAADDAYNYDQEENNAMTQDLPIVDVTADLHATPFEEEEQASTSE